MNFVGLTVLNRLNRLKLYKFLVDFVSLVDMGLVGSRLSLNRNLKHSFGPGF